MIKESLNRIKKIIAEEKANCADDHTGNTYRLACDNIWNLIEEDASTRKDEVCTVGSSSAKETSSTNDPLSIKKKLKWLRDKYDVWTKEYEYPNCAWNAFCAGYDIGRNDNDK